MQPWFARGLALAVVAVIVPVRVGAFLDDLSFRDPAPRELFVVGLAALAGLFATYIVVVLRRGNPWVLMGVLVVLTFGPYLLIGKGWGSIAGPLGAAILLTVRAGVSWLPLILVVVSDATIRAALGPLPRAVGTEWFATLLIDLNTALSLFAVARLAQLVGESHDVRRRLVEAEVKAERARAVDRLRLALGTQLSDVIQRVRTLLSSPAPTRPDLLELGAPLSRTVEEARSLSELHHDAQPPRKKEPPVREMVVTPFRFCWWTMFAIVAIFSAISLMNLTEPLTSAPIGEVWPMALATILVSGALQLYHGAPRVDGSAPRWWRWTLPSHMVFLVATALLQFGLSLLPLLFLAAGAVLVLVRPVWAWPILVLVSVFTTAVAFDGAGATNVWFLVYWALGPIPVALTVYALCSHPELTQKLHDTRGELARVAVIAERVRFARDVHDVFGVHLAAMTMKYELATRSLGNDVPAARAHLADLAHHAERALAEARSVSRTAGEMVLREEVGVARSLLDAVEITLSVDLPSRRLPTSVDRLLAVVVRESVTNVVRHSRAHHCLISVEVDAGVARLRVVNDGVAFDSTGEGSGHDNLAIRLEQAGGHLTTKARDGTYTLEATVPNKPGLVSGTAQ